jgi:hypothetical protein
MPLAQVIAQNLQPIGGALAVLPVIGVHPAHHIPGFHVPRQEQTNWCWAAVAAGVAAHYGAVWQQCDIAGLELGQHCCTAGKNSGVCNVPYFLDLALTRVGHFETMKDTAVPLSPYVIAEISADRPLGVRVGWGGAGDDGHFLAIAGYSTIGEQFVDVEDPWWSASTVPYAVLRSAYQGDGSWTHTYWTN